MQIKVLKADSKTKGFSLLAGINRPVNPGHVTKIAKSVDKIGIIRPVVIARISFITGKLIPYVVDGQHLTHALIRNEMDIPYVEIEVIDEKDLVEKIALLNASSKSWTMVDYVTAWGAVHPDYVKLMKYYNTYDLDLSQVANILYKGVATVGGADGSRAIKDGTFRVKDEADKINLLNNITDVLKKVPRMDRQSNRSFIYSYVNFYNGHQSKYNHVSFLNWLEKNKTKLLLVTQDTEQIMKLLEKSIK